MNRAFDRVRRRSIGVEEEILGEEGGLLSDVQFACALGLETQSVHNYRQAGKVFAVRKGKQHFQFPAWQVHRGTILDGLADVLAILAAKNVTPLAVALFFLTPAEALGDHRPLDLLRTANREEVIQHAERYGEMGS